MRILNSLIVPKNVEKGALVFFNIRPVAKYQKIEVGPFGDIKEFRENVSKPKKGRVKSHSAEKLKKGTFLGFVFQVRGFWMRSKSSTEYFW